MIINARLCYHACECSDGLKLITCDSVEENDFTTVLDRERAFKIVVGHISTYEVYRKLEQSFVDVVFETVGQVSKPKPCDAQYIIKKAMSGSSSYNIIVSVLSLFITTVVGTVMYKARANIRNLFKRVKNRNVEVELELPQLQSYNIATTPCDHLRTPLDFASPATS